MEGFKHTVNKSYRIVSDNGIEVSWEYYGADSEMDYRIHIGRSYGNTFTHFTTFTEEFAKQIMKALKGNEDNTYFEVTIEENNKETCI